MLFAQSFVNLNHEDTPITVDENGRLVGLPADYQNPVFDLETFTICISDHCIIVPRCVQDYFKSYDNYDINFAASWYHDPDVLPPYLRMSIVTAENPSEIQILLNLKTLEIFQIWEIKIEAKEGILSYIGEEKEIYQDCRDTIIDSILER